MKIGGGDGGAVVLTGVTGLVVVGGTVVLIGVTGFVVVGVGGLGGVANCGRYGVIGLGDCGAVFLTGFVVAGGAGRGEG